MDPDVTGRVRVPVPRDKQAETDVNNESIEIRRQFATAFEALGDGGLDFYPEDRHDEFDGVIDEIYDPINNGGSRAGFASSQSAYEVAVTGVFGALDHWDAVLADRHCLVANALTLADVRLFPTLVRFDHCFHTATKGAQQFIHQYDHLWPYLRDVYQTPAVADTVVWDHSKDQGCYQGEITPVGPDLDFEAPHNRTGVTA